LLTNTKSPYLQRPGLLLIEVRKIHNRKVAIPYRPGGFRHTTKGVFDMKKMLVVCLLVAVMGCASSGQYFTINDANRVTNGMTREEVVAIMGTNPYQITGQGKKFIWSYAHVGISGRMESRAVPFTFDDNGLTYGIPEGGMFGDTQKYR
jgi:hypothetical protein